MKKIFFTLIVTSFVFGINSCKKVDEWTQFTMDFDQESTINASLALPIPIGDLPLVTPEITTNSSTTFESNNTHKDLIEEAKLTKLTLEVKAPTDGDFSFLESVDVYISADGLDEILVASNNDVPAVAFVELTCLDKDLTEYIKKDQIDIRVKTVTDEILTEDYTINTHTEFFIDAKILGI